MSDRTAAYREGRIPIKRLTLVAIAALSCCAEAASAACNCTTMTLKYRNAVGGSNSSVYCVDSSAQFDECTTVSPHSCPTGKKAVRCPIGGAFGTSNGHPWVGTGFEVEANLPNNANLGDCTYGQGIQRSIYENGTRNGKENNSHTAPTGRVSYTGVDAELYGGGQFPYVDETDSNHRLKLGADDYTVISSSQTIDYTNHLLRWSDLPAIYVDGDTQKTVVVEDRFITFIRDKNSGTVYCACAFKIRGTKNAGGDSLSAAVFSQGAGKSCMFSAQ